MQLKNSTVLRENTLQFDENFKKVHPDLAALVQEVQEKENALSKLKAKKRAIKDELKAVKKELEKRLIVIDAWKNKGKPNGKSSARTRRKVAISRKRRASSS